MKQLTRDQARSYLVQYHRLSPPRRLKSDEEITSLIRKLGCLQYDPLNQTAKNADLVLQSRCRDYSESTLYRLLYEKRVLVDHWDKNMAIWPIEDWPHFHRKRKDFYNHYKQREQEFREVREKVLELIQKKGCISSADIEKQAHQVHWSWAPTTMGRAVLESMYHSGELTVHHKEGTRKFYGLSKELIPNDLYGSKEPFRNDEEYQDWYVLRRIRSVGMLWNQSSEAWLGPNLKKTEREAPIRRLLDAGVIEELKVEGLKLPLYKPADEEIPEELTKPEEAALIAPLDNFIWERYLTSELYDFHYRWEVYTPVKKRKYGYYVLPVLFGNRFIARCEPRLDRKKQLLHLENFWWEEHLEATDSIRRALVSCFTDFCRFLNAGELKISRRLAQKKFQWLREETNELLKMDGTG